MSDKEYVYMATCGPYVKVGLTRNPPNERIKQLDGGTPTPTALLHYWTAPCALDLERALHVLLRKYNERREWFLLPIEVIDALCETPDDVMEMLANVDSPAALLLFRAVAEGTQLKVEHTCAPMEVPNAEEG